MIALVNGVSELKLDDGEGWAFVVESQWTNSDVVHYKDRIKDPYRSSRCRYVSMFTHELEHIGMYDSVYSLLNSQNQYIYSNHILTLPQNHFGYILGSRTNPHQLLDVSNRL